MLTEMTNVSAEGRITPGCTGIYTDEQVAGWKRIVEYVHGNSAAAIGIQMGHSGPKGSTIWEKADYPLEEGNWEISHHRFLTFRRVDTAGDDSSYGPGTRRVLAATRTEAAGFDWLELHGHGYRWPAFCRL